MPQISMKVGNTRIRADGLGKKFRGLLVMALLSLDHAQQMERMRMLWIDLQDLFAGSLGLRQAAGLVVTDCQVK